MAISEQDPRLFGIVHSRPDYHIGQADVRSRLVRERVVNCVRIVSPNGFVHILGRVITEVGKGHRDVDRSKLMVLGARKEGDYEFFPPNMPDDIEQIEDPRYCNGIVGVAVLHKRKPGESFKTSIGLIETGYDEFGKLIAKSIHVFPLTNPDGSHLSVRNITPINVGRKGKEKKVDLLARIEDGKHDHTLSQLTAIVDFSNQTGEITHIRDIVVPTLFEDSKKVGTVGVPLHQKDGTELIFGHRQIEIDPLKDQREYSLWAGILRNDELTHITGNAILTRGQIHVSGELHPYNRALYSTDNLSFTPDGRYVKGLVSVGDLDTAAVKIPSQNIWDQLIPVASLPTKRPNPSPLRIPQYPIFQYIQA